MMLELQDKLMRKGAVAQHWAAVRCALGVSRQAPLSARHALHAAVLIDRLSDITFTRRLELPLPPLATAGDFSIFRAGLRVCEPSLGPIMDLTACSADGPRFEVVATKVASDGYSGLPVADLMVSLYNDGRIPRLMLVQRDGTMLPIQNLMLAATHWWGKILET